MDHRFEAENQYCIITPLKHEDIESLRNWRNDSELSAFLSPLPYITSEAEEQWFNRYLHDAETIFFMISDKKARKKIGSVAIYNIKESECDVGKIVIGENSAHGKGFGYNALLLAMCVAIKKLGITVFHLNVHNDNIAALSIYIKAGFEICGSHEFVKGGKELEMIIGKERFESCNPDYHDVKVYFSKNGEG